MALKGAAALVLLLSVATACDVGRAEPFAVDAPPVELVEVRLTTLPCANPDAGDCSKSVRTSIAELGTKSVSTGTSITLIFDRFLDPRTATRQSLCLRSGSTAPVRGLADCTNQVFLEPSYDPVRRSVTYRLPQGTRLAPDSLYQLTALSPLPGTRSGFRAFDGAALKRNREFSFTTDARLDTPIDPFDFGDLYCAGGCPAGSDCNPNPETDCLAACDRLTSTASPCGCDGADAPTCSAACVDACRAECPVATTFATSCALGGCHASSNAGTPSFAAMGLELGDASAIERTARSRTAHETEQGERASVPDESPFRFGRAMPLIDPGNPGNSYLVYKMLIHPAYTHADSSAKSGEFERLRGAFVMGEAMPIASTPVRAEALQALSQWIADGATAHACVASPPERK